MRNIFFVVLGFIASKIKKGRPSKDGFSPYDSAQSNLLYNALFCDKLGPMRRLHAAKAASDQDSVWERVLAPTPTIDALNSIAADQAQDSRLRVFAYHRLRELKQPELKQPVQIKQLFGVIIELGMPNGLDTLAAYSDGHVRYFNHAGITSAYEAAARGWMPKVYRLLTAAQSAVDRIGPWEQMRLAPPTNGHVRMTFLVSDGLYFGEGPVQVMQQEAMAKPIVAAGLELLKAIVAYSEKETAASQS